MEKAYLDENNSITLHCPGCGLIKEVDVSAYLEKDGPIKLSYRFHCDNCTCGHKDCKECSNNNCTNGHTNVIEVERRKFFRKKVNLAGSLTDRSGRSQAIRVIDLSRSGVKIKLFTQHRFTSGTRLVAEFTLDNARKTSVKKEIIVRKYEDNIVDGEFLLSENVDASDKAIGFYLMQ